MSGAGIGGRGERHAAAVGGASGPASTAASRGSRSASATREPSSRQQPDHRLVALGHLVLPRRLAAWRGSACRGRACRPAARRRRRPGRWCRRSARSTRCPKRGPGAAPCPDRRSDPRRCDPTACAPRRRRARSPRCASSAACDRTPTPAPAPASVQARPLKRYSVFTNSAGSPLNGAASVLTRSRNGTVVLGSPPSSASAHASVAGSSGCQRKPRGPGSTPPLGTSSAIGSVGDAFA